VDAHDLIHQQVKTKVYGEAIAQAANARGFKPSRTSTGRLFGKGLPDPKPPSEAGSNRPGPLRIGTEHCPDEEQEMLVVEKAREEERGAVPGFLR